MIVTTRIATTNGRVLSRLLVYGNIEMRSRTGGGSLRFEDGRNKVTPASYRPMAIHTRYVLPVTALDENGRFKNIHNGQLVK